MLGCGLLEGIRTQADTIGISEVCDEKISGSIFGQKQEFKKIKIFLLLSNYFHSSWKKKKKKVFHKFRTMYIR